MKYKICATKKYNSDIVGKSYIVKHSLFGYPYGEPTTNNINEAFTAAASMSKLCPEGEYYIGEVE